MKVDDLVEIVFWDHCTNMAPVKCRVWGKVAFMNRLHIEVCTWEVESNDQDVKDGNREYVSILKKAVISKRILVAAPSTK